MGHYTGVPMGGDDGEGAFEVSHDHSSSDDSSDSTPLNLTRSSNAIHINGGYRMPWKQREPGITSRISGATRVDSDEGLRYEWVAVTIAVT